MNKILIVKNTNFWGDYQQLLGISTKLQKQFLENGYDISVEEYKSEDMDKISGSIKKSKKRTILITSGYYGINVIKKIKNNNEIADKVFAIHSSHKLLGNSEFSHKDLIQDAKRKGADVIAVPSHVLDSEVVESLKTDYSKLVITVGVSHNLTPSILKAEYEKFKKEIPAAKKYILFILGGDIPRDNSKVDYFTTQEASKLANYIAKLAKKEDYFVLVTNGPRTGKYDEKTGKELLVHRDGVVDSVSKRFIEELNKLKVRSKLFDFQRGKPSAYKALLAVTRKNSTKSKVFVPGGSTSMISECLDSLPVGTVTIYNTSAMNKNHKKHVMAEYNSGRANLLDDRLHYSQVQIKKQKPLSASDEIAKVIMQAIK